jgi:hypothetical protein
MNELNYHSTMNIRQNVWDSDNAPDTYSEGAPFTSREEH